MAPGSNVTPADAIARNTRTAHQMHFCPAKQARTRTRWPPRSRSHRHALAITLKLSLPSRHTTGSKQKCQGSVILTRKPRAGNRHPSGPEEVRGRSGGLGLHRAQWARGHSDHGHLDPAEGLVPANCKCCKASVSPPGKGEQRQQGCAKPSAARECRDHS